MSDDILETLRHKNDGLRITGGGGWTLDAEIKEITSLRARVAELEAALARCREQTARCVKNSG